MRIPALFRFFALFVLFAVLFAIVASPTYAESYEPNTNPDVPQNQHTKSQVILIEGSAAIICQLAGIDIIQPEKGCLAVDPTTQKIGYASHQSETLHVGGLLGLSSSLLGAVYTPPASGTTYVAGVVDNFGIVKKTYAQETSGFEALNPVLKLWEIARNVTYALLVLVFVLLGLGIMLRVKIDPRTAMTIQNQVPRIVVAILLITFSYAIVGFMIDLMWLSTYVGINALSSTTQETICSSGGEQQLRVGESAYANLLNSPLAFMNDVLKHPEPPGINNHPSATDCDLGAKYLSLNVSYVAGNFINTLVLELFGLEANPDCGPFAMLLNAGCFAGDTLARFIGWIGQVLMLLVAFLAILVVMFRLWWQLLKAYALIIFYTILGPFWILLGLLPNSERNFNSWLRTLTAKLASFPAAAFMIVLARVVLDTYNANTGEITVVNPSEYFIPPLVGNPNMGLLGPLLAFAILLIAPDVLNMLNDALKAPASKYVGPAITGGAAAGFAAGAPAGFLARRATRVDAQGRPTGAVSGLFYKWAGGEHGGKPSGRLNTAKWVAGRAGSFAVGGRPGGTGGGSTSGGGGK